MVRLLRLFMIVMLLLLLPLAASAQIVEVDGYGDDKESAMKDAKRNAASILAGTLIKSNTLVKNGYVISDDIFARTAGYIRLVKIIKEENNDGYHIVAQMEGGKEFENTLRSSLDVVNELNNPRISVFINENGSYNKISFDGISCEGMIANYLVEKGMTNVVAGNRNADCEYKAIITLVTTTKPIKLQSYQDMSAGKGGESTRQDTGLLRAVAAMELRVIDADTNELVGQFTLEANAMDSDGARARRTAAREVTFKAGDKIWEIFNRHSAVVGDEKVLKVRVADYQKLDNLLQIVKSLDGVEGAVTREYKGGKAMIGLNTTLSSQALYRRIAERYDGVVRVENLADDTLELSIN